MTTQARPSVFLDTSYIRGIKWDSANFQSLLHFSKTQKLDIFISWVAWEERRTQYVEKIFSQCERVRETTVFLQKSWKNGLIVDGLPEPVLNLPSKSTLEKESSRIFGERVEENRIHILEIGGDHGDRVWNRYFSRSQPFSPTEKREEIRKDIPDAWILEAGIDLLSDYPDVIGLCGDEKLREALKDHGMEVIDHGADYSRITTAVLERVDAINSSQPATDNPAVVVDSDVTFESLRSEKQAKDDARMRRIEVLVMGFLGALGATQKERLFDLVVSQGFEFSEVSNIADRLTITQSIAATDGYYMPKDLALCQRASQEVRQEIIDLVNPS